MEQLREASGLTEANEWSAFDGMARQPAARALIERAPINSVPTRNHAPEVIPVPPDLAPAVGGASAKLVSSQAAFTPTQTRAITLALSLALT